MKLMNTSPTITLSTMRAIATPGSSAHAVKRCKITYSLLQYPNNQAPGGNHRC